MMIGLPARARALGSGQKFGRTADMLDVDHDRAGGAVVGEVLDEVDEVEAGLVAGRDRVGRRQVAALEGLAQMRHEAAALRDDRERRIAFALRRAAPPRHARSSAVKPST